MILSILTVVAVLLVSVAALLLLTKRPYLDAYFVLDAFLDAQNTAASSEIAAIAFSSNIYVFSAIFAIVILDNISRILITSFILAAVIDLIGGANFEQAINQMKVNLMRNHVIICGYNDLTKDLIQLLQKNKIRFVILVGSVEEAKELNKERLTNLVVDVSDEKSFRKAGVNRAKAIVFSSENDPDNAIGTLIARKINSRIRILTRLKDEKVRKKIYIAGADMAVIPEYLAGIEIGEFIRKNIGGAA